jgi:hypothetical protein
MQFNLRVRCKFRELDPRGLFRLNLQRLCITTLDIFDLALSSAIFIADNAKLRRIGAFAEISSRIAGFKSTIKNSPIASLAYVIST